MFLGKRIKELREEKRMLQRHLAAKLDMDTPMYSKIERGERKAKREQILKLAMLLDTDEKELLTLWLADQVYALVRHEDNATQALNFVIKEMVGPNKEL
jgi:transcriptional regulator with XRE-family HTH domain